MIDRLAKVQDKFETEDQYKSRMRGYTSGTQLLNISTFQSLIYVAQTHIDEIARITSFNNRAMTMPSRDGLRPVITPGSEIHTAMQALDGQRSPTGIDWQRLGLPN